MLISIGSFVCMYLLRGLHLLQVLHVWLATGMDLKPGTRGVWSIFSFNHEDKLFHRRNIPEADHQANPRHLSSERQDQIRVVWDMLEETQQVADQQLCSSPGEK